MTHEIAENLHTVAIQVLISVLLHSVLTCPATLLSYCQLVLSHTTSQESRFVVELVTKSQLLIEGR